MYPRCPRFLYLLALLISAVALVGTFCVWPPYNFPLRTVTDVFDRRAENAALRHNVPIKPNQEDAKYLATGVVDTPKRNKVIKMIKHAWDGYVKYAWGANEVRPVSKTSYSGGSIFGGASIGLTIVDSLDTLLIAGLTEEYEKAKQWIEKEFQFEGPYDVSVFETNIRLVGGFLSAYALTQENVFLKQAVHVANKLLPAFDTPTGIPRPGVIIENDALHLPGWVPVHCPILSEFGTLSMEFLYLSELTGDDIYREKINKIIDFLKSVRKDEGLFPNYVGTDSDAVCSRITSIGACGDSFYEYLFKTWLQTDHNEETMKVAYDSAMERIFSKLYQISAKGHHYFAEMHSGSLEHKMEHLGCFIGGLLALSAKHAQDEHKYMDAANAIGETCHQSYNMTRTGLGPEAFSFETGTGTMLAYRESYILRPEVIETYFYMWRLTHDQKWRDYGWEAVQAIEKHCRAEAGYSGLNDVNALPPEKDDVQQSFFLAETLKYLYLLFSPDDVIPLDKFVFNTEAHPLPIFRPSWRNLTVVYRHDLILVYLVLLLLYFACLCLFLFKSGYFRHAQLRPSFRV